MVERLVHPRRPAQYPKIFARRLADDGVFIVWAKIQNPIITIEGPEKRNLQFGICFLIDNFGLAFGRSILTRSFTASINDFDITVCTYCVVRRHGIGAFLLE